MARVKISEYRAKKLILGTAYTGLSFADPAEVSWNTSERYVVKVDQGIKKRMKQGLVAVDVGAKDIAKTISIWKQKGFSKFIAEPLVAHAPAEERYLSLERVREGIRVLYAAEGGIDIEEHPEAVRKMVIAAGDSGSDAARTLGLPESFFVHLLEVFQANYFGFLEINPLVMQGESIYLLDAAVLVDSAAQFFVKGAWGEDDIPEEVRTHPAEAAVAALQQTTPASLKLRVLNPDGSLFFLLSGGGGSIVIADEAALLGRGDQIGNYGEYSGAPTREETYLYAKEILALMLASKAKKKALIIAGGVANFTDVMKTFAGIIDALSECAAELKKQGVRVFVRRGGPNEKAGLAAMKDFLEKNDLLGSVHGSDAVITLAIDEAIASIS